MIAMSAGEVWFIIATLGVGTFAIRFSFLGLLGDQRLSPWVLRHLRYTAVAVLPALIAPLILWLEATGGAPDPIRLAAAAVTLAVGCMTKNAVGAMVAGFAAFYALSAVIG